MRPVSGRKHKRTREASVPRKTKEPAAPVHVTNTTRRSDQDALEGHLVEVVSGEHKGKRGAFVRVEEHDEKTGFPHRILVKSRLHGLFGVLYKDVHDVREHFGGD